ncbi:hypothetical protein [uncultured Actinomyces sp.]|uniref:hypothetical protein n=1 Tax=uncultured Actinomyces sp. TaxID=249061 RepID=UPI00288A94A0|nr:hypothetical protein [uncultured Actinomyces sp.]
MSEEPIISIPSDPTPAPPAQPTNEKSGEAASPREAHLDLRMPILEVLTNPNLPDL